MVCSVCQCPTFSWVKFRMIYFLVCFGILVYFIFLIHFLMGGKLLYNVVLVSAFSNESTLHMRWPKYWSFSFSIIPSKEIPGLISFRVDWISLQSKGLSRVFSNTTVQKHQFFGTQPSSQSNSHIHT